MVWVLIRSLVSYILDYICQRLCVWFCSFQCGFFDCIDYRTRCVLCSRGGGIEYIFARIGNGFGCVAGCGGVGWCIRLLSCL